MKYLFTLMLLLTACTESKPEKTEKTVPEKVQIERDILKEIDHQIDKRSDKKDQEHHEAHHQQHHSERNR